MTQDSSVKKIQLNDYLFSKAEIETAIAKREHIFEIQIDEINLGYISLYDLKDFASFNASYADRIFIRNIDKTNFIIMHEHPLFQRRKPQVLLNVEETLPPNEQIFHALIKGQKCGPYTQAQIEALLKNNEIILNDMISLNAGLTWQKLYSAPSFDRRAMKPTVDLPGLPEEDLLKKGPADLRIADEVMDATTSLAYLGNIKKAKNGLVELSQLDQETKRHEKLTGSSYKWLFIFSLIGVIYFLFNIQSVLQSPLPENPTQSLGEQVEQLKPTDSFQNTKVMNTSPRQSEKFKSPSFNPIRGAKVRPGQKSFQEANPGSFSNNRELNDASYYYDNAAPMELDPVREQVSKETYDNNGMMNPGEPGPPPADDALFNQENSN
jgi:hypothetical protein